MFVSLLLEVAEGEKRRDGGERSGTSAHKVRGEEEERETKTKGLQLVGTTKEEDEGQESKQLESEFVTEFLQVIFTTYAHTYTHIYSHTHTHIYQTSQPSQFIFPFRRQNWTF